MRMASILLVLFPQACQADRRLLPAKREEPRDLLELGDELPGQRWNKGFQAIIPAIGPVIHGRRSVCAIEPAHFDRIARLAPFEVVADVFLAAVRHVRDGCGNCTAIDLSVLNDAALPTAIGVTPNT